MRIFVCLCAILLAYPGVAAEDFRVMKLEQDMRTLERHVQTLQRQLGELQQQLRRSDSSVELRAPRADDVETSDGWLNASAWNRVENGMSELQVIELLGKPTALRPDAQGHRTLLYTLEIGTTGFLTGSISFEDGKVVEIRTPTLK